jgi:hypothetical protein
MYIDLYLTSNVQFIACVLCSRLRWDLDSSLCRRPSCNALDPCLDTPVSRARGTRRVAIRTLTSGHASSVSMPE